VTVGGLENGFYVEDSGPGIPPSARESIFDAGYAAAEGAGLGLAIVNRIVEAHGWTVTVTEGNAGGARFEIRDVETVPE
jgi:signal transduction histidine kinase